MSTKGFPINQQEYPYDAQEVSYFFATRHSGVFALGDNCKVSISSGMTVKVAKGKGWLAHGMEHGVVFWMDSDSTVTLPVGDGLAPRWDFVCIGWNTAEYKENPTIYVKSGMPTLTPQEPTLENSLDKIEICLAKIYIPAGTTSLSDSGVQIYDVRASRRYCGLVGDDLRIDSLEDTTQYIEQMTNEAESDILSTENKQSENDNNLYKIETGASTVKYAYSLSKSRKINGTDYDGSKGITTEKWGVARNMTIDGVTQLVDGSKDLDFLTTQVIHPTSNHIEGVSKVGEKKLYFKTIQAKQYISRTGVTQLVMMGAKIYGKIGFSFIHVIEAGSGEFEMDSYYTFGDFILIIGV